MITCKEDLIGTYIKNDHGKLRDLYIGSFVKFGVRSCDDPEFNYLIKANFIHCMKWKDHSPIQAEWSNNRGGERELTLADFKPKTKVKYVKCRASDVDKLYTDDVFLDDKGELCIRDASISEFLCTTLYRKVETEITWETELADIVKSKSINGDGLRFPISDTESFVCLDTQMLESDFLEMCSLVHNANN